MTPRDIRTTPFLFARATKSYRQRNRDPRFRHLGPYRADGSKRTKPTYAARKRRQRGVR